MTPNSSEWVKLLHLLRFRDRNDEALRGMISACLGHFVAPLLAILFFLLPASGRADRWVHGCGNPVALCAAADIPWGCCTGPGAGDASPTDGSAPCLTIADNTITGSTNLNADATACWSFVDTDGFGAGNESPQFSVVADDASICYQHDLTSAAAPGGADALMSVFWCPDNDPDPAGTNVDFNCIDLGGANGSASLSGLEGALSVQNSCIFVGPGTYIARPVTRACAAGAVCRLIVNGQDTRQ